MSQKNDPTCQAIESAANFIGKSLFAVASGTTAFVVDKLQVPPEEQLRQLNARPVWGEQITAVTCVACETQNEADAEICFRCGSAMNYRSDSKSSTGEQIIPSDVNSKLNEWLGKPPDGWRWW